MSEHITKVAAHAASELGVQYEQIRVPFTGGRELGAYARKYAAADAAGQLSLTFHFEVLRAKTNRDRVLKVINEAERLLTGHEVAERAGISYKQALHALTFLNNERRVSREGRKFTSRWGRLVPITSHTALEDFLQFIRVAGQV
ncbi:hypothetical protein SAMN05216345_107360 [Cupriavidus sp. YR651]|uniref:hypothetical protein n=1 Tax=Cupriavidus sp. YR651 TaxID=1855315 RepID=UPI000891DD8F|nr:hypothetical protein [Cupriavidus sp. YR651]SDD30456.1 hypothetical protein SAMN05216345_107360 [Cupriavidus sp. YR651]